MDRESEELLEPVDEPGAGDAITGAEEWLSTLADPTSTIQE